MSYSLTWFGALTGWCSFPASAGVTIQWDEYSHLNGAWFAETLGLNAADADALLFLLEALEHSVSLCDAGRVFEINPRIAEVV